MRAPSYDSKRNAALAQDERVKKVHKKLDFIQNKGPMKYVKQRLAELRKVRGY